MIKDAITKLLFVNEDFHDGGLEAILSIIKYYKGNTSMVNFNELINKIYDNANSFENLRSVAKEYGLIAVICNDNDIKTIIEYNQPVIINISHSNKQNHFVVCYGFDDKDGFKIYDSKNGYYYASVIGLQSLWNDNKCLALVN